MNDDKSNHPYPEFTELVKLTEGLMRVSPDISARNPETAQVYEELGGMLTQTNVKPSVGEIIQMYIVGELKDIDAALKEYNEKLNKGLKDAIERAKEKGANVSHDDLFFRIGTLPKTTRKKI